MNQAGHERIKGGKEEMEKVAVKMDQAERDEFSPLVRQVSR